MKKIGAICFVILMVISVSANVFAYSFQVPQAIVESVEAILIQQKAQQAIVGPEALGFANQAEIDSLKVSEIIPLIDLNMTSIYAGLDKDYLSLNARFISPNFDGIAKSKVSKISELNLMDPGSSSWFVILDSKQNVELNASMIINTDIKGQAELQSFTGPGDYLKVFKTTLSQLERLALQKGTIDQIILYFCEDAYFFAATVSDTEWILPLPIYQFDAESIDSWQPKQLWTVDELVQAYKNNLKKNKASWLEDPNRAGGGIDLSIIPVVEDDSQVNVFWFMIPVGVVLLAVIGLLIFRKKKSKTT